jgi:ABC-type glycerol-3-phosphate transport system permease component
MPNVARQPQWLDEAALIDGANRWQAFRLIVLPTVRLAVTALFSAPLAYNALACAACATRRCVAGATAWCRVPWSMWQPTCCSGSSRMRDRRIA